MQGRQHGYGPHPVGALLAGLFPQTGWMDGTQQQTGKMVLTTKDLGGAY